MLPAYGDVRPDVAPEANAEVCVDSDAEGGFDVIGDVMDTGASGNSNGRAREERLLEDIISIIYNNNRLFFFQKVISNTW